MAGATRKDYAHFVSIAKGSLAELETFLLLIAELDLAPRDQIDPVLLLAEEVGRMLTALRARLGGAQKPSLEPGP